MFVLVLAGALMTACSRRHTSPYQGAATKMNFGRQVINPKAPTDPDLPQEVTGTTAQSVYQRYSDTFKKAVPDCLFEESCTYGAGQQQADSDSELTELQEAQNQ